MNNVSDTVPVTPPDQANAQSVHPILSTSSDDQSFKLLRVILVDAISAGKIVHFELDGGAVLTGDNGRGKTSYLNLIPMFYGANPNSLVSKGKDSFIGYYLPRSTSYIVFEYRHFDGQNRMVVAYSNSTGDKVFYRFVRQGFDQKMFISDDGLINNGHFRARLSELKVKCSQQQIETYSDYKSIIQYNMPKTSDRRHKEHLKDLSADYAFTRYNKALTNVDRLALGMFSRTANFEVLQSIVVENIFDNQTSQSINVDRSKIENWPRNCRAYNESMALAPTFEKANQDKLAIEQNLKNLSGLRVQIGLLIDDLSGKESTARDDLAGAVGERAKHQERFSEVHFSDEKKRMQVAFDRDRFDEELTKILNKKSEYDLLGIAEKRKEYDKKKSFEQTLQSLKNHYSALTESNLPIVAKFDKLMADIRVAYSNEVESNVIKADAVRERCITELKALDEQLNQQESMLEAHFEEKRSGYLTKIDALNVQLGSCQQNLKNPQVPQDLIEALEKVDNEVTGKRGLSDDAAKTLREKEGSFVQAKASHDQALSALSSLFEQVQVQSARVKQVILDNTPDKESLLSFLREEIPSWKSDIARLIRPDILHRTDLSPIFDAQSSSFFGLSLKLDNLDARPESDVNYLAELIYDEERKLELIKGKHASAKEKADGLERVLKKAETEKNAASKAALQCKSALQIAEANKVKAQHVIEQARKLAKETAQRTFDEVTQRCATLRQESNEHEEKERSERALRKTQRHNKERAIRAEEQNDLNLLASSLKNKEIKRELDLSNMAKQCEQALSNEGVDAESLNKVNTEIAAVEASIKHLQGILPLLQAWVPWEKDVYSTRAKVEMSLENEIKALSEIEATIAEHERQHKHDDDLMAQAIDALEKKLAKYALERTKANAIAEKLKGFVDTNVHQVFDQSYTVDSLDLLMTEWLTDWAKNNKSIEQKIAALRKGFEQYVNSGVHGFYDNYRQNHDLDKPIDYMGLFSTWYEGRHQEVRTLLRSTAAVFSDEVVHFHQKLKTFSEHLARFNRNLQEGLEATNSYFRQISGLVINIHSSVDELKSWGTIKALVDSRSSWINTENSIPGPDFLEHLETLLGQWDVKNGITADFKHLVNIRGEVIENGNLRKFKNSEEFNNLSSNGLSYLILIVIFVGFWKMIRKDSPVHLVWALDELKVISQPNISGLMRMLNEGNITLASAFPDPDVTTLCYFRHAYTIDPQRRLVTYRINRLGAEKGAQDNV